MKLGNEPAYPSIKEFERFNDDTNQYETYHEHVGGLTKREVFAMAAMQGLLANEQIQVAHANISQEKGVRAVEVTANIACKYADALLKELESTSEWE